MAVTGYGVFGDPPRVGFRRGDTVFDLSRLDDVFRQPSLNAFMAEGPTAWADTRARVAEGEPVPRKTIDAMVDLALLGVASLGKVQLAALHVMQGDLASLQRRGRRVLRLHLADPESGLARLQAMMHEALAEPARA